MPSSNILVTIVFVPPGPITEELVSLNKKLSEEYKAYFLSEFPVYTPHVSIYQAMFPQKSEEDVLRNIRSMAVSLTEMLFVPTGINIKGRYIAIGFEKNKEIELLHKEMVARLNPLREGNIKDEYKNSSVHLSAEEKENISAWGYPYAMNLYHPHLTVIRLADEKNAKQISQTITWNKPILMNKIVAVVRPMNGKERAPGIIHKFSFS